MKFMRAYYPLALRPNPKSIHVRKRHNSAVYYSRNVYQPKIMEMRVGVVRLRGIGAAFRIPKRATGL